MCKILFYWKLPPNSDNNNNNYKNNNQESETTTLGRICVIVLIVWQHLLHNIYANYTHVNTYACMYAYMCS